MSTRLQVVVDEQELARFRRSAAASGLTLSDWARRALRRAERDVSHGDVEAKLTVLRRAAGHRFPAPDIDVMLSEIERGREV